MRIGRGTTPNLRPTIPGRKPKNVQKYGLTPLAFGLVSGLVLPGRQIIAA